MVGCVKTLRITTPNRATRVLQVRVKPGWRENMRISMRYPVKEPEQAVLTVVFIVKELPNMLYRRLGRDDLEVRISTSSLSRVTLRTVCGKTLVVEPPSAASPAFCKIIDGFGMVSVDGARRGKLYVHFEIYSSQTVDSPASEAQGHVTTLSSSASSVGSASPDPPADQADA